MMMGIAFVAVVIAWAIYSYVIALEAVHVQYAGTTRVIKQCSRATCATADLETNKTLQRRTTNK